MTSDFIKSIGGLAFKYNSYSKLVEDLYLSAIVDSFQRILNIPQIKTLTEPEIRNYLAFDLINKNQFLQPYLQSNILQINIENHILLSPIIIKRTDIEFFISRCHFVVECKNLKYVDQEYINEGVVRFTEEYYSKSDSEAGMIGFIVDGNINKIINGLKQRVVAHEPTANCQQLSDQPCINYAYSFHSEHNRKTQQSILVHHLFVNL
jgi:hypothetical protein